MNRPSILEVEKAIEVPFRDWAHQCHFISLEIVKSDLLQGPRRIARGWCDGVRGQHSWIVLGDDCYAEDAGIVDPTLWSYDDSVEGIWYGSAEDGRHRPHGAGSIWEWGMPVPGGGPPIELEGVSSAAKAFLRMLYPLDIMGWHTLASEAPVQGWPAGEVYEAMSRHPELGALVPVDRLGMLTDLNPGGLYLPETLKEVEA